MKPMRQRPKKMTRSSESEGLDSTAGRNQNINPTVCAWSHRRRLQYEKVHFHGQQSTMRVREDSPSSSLSYSLIFGLFFSSSPHAVAVDVRFVRRAHFGSFINFLSRTPTCSPSSPRPLISMSIFFFLLLPHVKGTKNSHKKLL